MSDSVADLAQELREALDDPKRFEWGEGPWEHLGDAERDVRVLLDRLAAAEAALESIENVGDRSAAIIASEALRSIRG